MTVHEIAAAGYDKEAATYERSRPSYPPEAVRWIAEQLDLAPSVRCVDLAAGTGILTRLLVPFDCDLVAVEPVAGMRATMRALLPHVATLSATAESLPFADHSIDAVTVAQAFHWFDAPRALTELRRVLKPGSGFVALWNARDRSRSWVDAVWSVMDRVEKHAPWRDHDHVAGPESSYARHEQDFAAAPGFAPARTAQFMHEQRLTHAGVVERVKGVSHVATLPGEQQAAVLEEVAAILRTHPDTRAETVVAIPYRVDCFALHSAVG